MDIIYDIDGFCSFANQNAECKSLADGKSVFEDKLITVDSEPQSIDCLIEQYYLGLRSAMFICEDTVEEESEVEETLQIWRKSSLKEAWGYVRHHITFGKVLSPDFMWIIKSVIIDELKDKYPNIENIQLKFSMKPKLSAKVTNENIITFPALSRVILNYYNLVIINTIFRVINEDGKINWEKLIKEEDDIKRNIVRLMLPYLLFCHDDFSVANLPIIGAHSKDALLLVTHFTMLQLIFIFAHEYAHIILKHLKKTEITSGSNIDIESEADNLALKVVLGYVEKDNSYSILDVFTAIRWLFKYQLLEENVGTLVRGERLKASESMFEERRSKFQLEILKNPAFIGSSMFEMIGFFMITDFQSILYNFEPEFISYIIDKLKETKKTGVVEPWWEKI